jgi:hypothetical protein
MNIAAAANFVFGYTLDRNIHILLNINVSKEKVGRGFFGKVNFILTLMSEEQKEMIEDLQLACKFYGIVPTDIEDGSIYYVEGEREL